MRTGPRRYLDGALVSQYYCLMVIDKGHSGRALRLPAGHLSDESNQAPAEPLVERTTDRKTARSAEARWVVHLGLLVTAAASLATLQLLHVRVAYHTVVGLIFVGLVLVHLIQRRHTIARMATQLVRARPVTERRVRLTISDLVLLFITLNVLASGIVDWGRGSPTRVPLPVPFERWHADAAAALVVYLIVHVIRRRKRLRRSRIR